MECKKPEVDKMRYKAVQVYKYLELHKDRYVTKQELSIFMDGMNERTIRDIINWIRNKKVMIISTSAKKGYKLADPKNADDIEEVKHMWAEVDHRQLELESMKKCCSKFLKDVESKKEEQANG